MKPMNLFAKIVMAAVVVVGLGACGKKKGGGGAAATPTSTCVYNQQYGGYFYAGTMQQCQPGVNGGQYGTNCTFNPQLNMYVTAGTNTPCQQQVGGQYGYGNNQQYNYICQMTYGQSWFYQNGLCVRYGGGYY